MLQYNPNLKQIARRLRRETTESERMLWSHLRRRQLLDVQFYRQKPIGNYIVDFYAPKARLVIEVDGSQHLEEIHSENDVYRDECLASQGLKVLRFNNLQVLKECDAVLEVIHGTLEEHLNKNPLAASPFRKGGLGGFPPLP